MMLLLYVEQLNDATFLYVLNICSLYLFQGHVEVCTLLADSQVLQENAEYYVVLEGSRIRHVITAQRKEESKVLSFTVPGKIQGLPFTAV